MKWYTPLAFLAFTSLTVTNLYSENVKLLKNGFKFTEGAVLSPQGEVFFTDIPNNRIHVYNPQTQSTRVHRENTGGANGLAFSAKGELYACEGSNRQISKQSGQDEPKLVANSFEKRKLNSPNDLVFDASGGLYFTDPRYGSKDNLEQDCEGVYYVHQDGRVQLMIRDLKKPNGIATSPDQKTLYVADNGTGYLHAYPILANGQLGEGRILSKEAPVNDGLCVDDKGVLYVTTKEGIRLFHPEGHILRTIVLPEIPANCALGPKGSNLLYVTAQTGLYQIKL